MAGINGLSAMFNAQTVQNIFDQFINDNDAKVLQSLQYIGEEFINKARLNGNYKDKTGNLRSSIGYIILKDGEIFEQSFIGGKTEGENKGKEFASEVASEYSNGWVLIGVAGMEYAASVEAHNYDVITGSAPTKQMLNSILSGIKP